MAEKVKLRYQRVTDAEKIYNILNNPNFRYFHVCPKDVKGEREFLLQNLKKRKKNFSYNYTILYGGKIVGGCGIKIDQHRTFIGEIGYFLDESFWGKGITTQVVKILEKICFKELKLKRIEIRMQPENKASEKVAIKCGYKKEGTLNESINDGGIFKDAYLYAKVK